MLCSCKVKDFSFIVFHDKASVNKDFRYDIVTT